MSRYGLINLEFAQQLRCGPQLRYLLEALRMRGQDPASQFLHLQLLQSMAAQVSLSFRVLDNIDACLLKSVCDHVSHSPALVFEQTP